MPTRRKQCTRSTPFIYGSERPYEHGYDAKRSADRFRDRESATPTRRAAHLVILLSPKKGAPRARCQIDQEQEAGTDIAQEGCGEPIEPRAAQDLALCEPHAASQSNRVLLKIWPSARVSRKFASN